MFPYTMGWIPDLKDFRDYTSEAPEVLPLIQAANVTTNISTYHVPSVIDLSHFCSPVEDQKNLGSCTAHAGIGLVEFHERRATRNQKHIDMSRLFLYKVTRKLLKLSGDTGASLRATIGAMVMFGVPPEEYYPYNIEKFDEEPPAFCYAFADNFKTIRYVRLDPSGQSTTKTLDLILAYLRAGYPSIFGFTCYTSLDDADTGGTRGMIPFPAGREDIIGGHAVMAVGYNNDVEIVNVRDGKKQKGAIMVRNSWSRNWGLGGYGYLPYAYVLEGLANDWWTVISQSWIDTSQFRG